MVAAINAPDSGEHAFKKFQASWDFNQLPSLFLRFNSTIRFTFVGYYKIQENALANGTYTATTSSPQAETATATATRHGGAANPRYVYHGYFTVMFGIFSLVLGALLS